MTATCNCKGNKALDPFFPLVVEAGQTITNTNGSVEKLAVCIFGLRCFQFSLVVSTAHRKTSNKLLG